MKKIKIKLLGESGKMGREISALAAADKQVKMVQKTAASDVVLDFTHSEEFSKSLAEALKNKKAFISGTTGLSEKQKKEIKAASKKIPILWSSNMSGGIMVFNEMLKALGPIKDYEFFIEETHHAQKKDSPSGTAITIKNNLEKTIGKKIKEVESHRVGEIFGEHRVRIVGPEETILIEHHALNRTVFARGALRCAKWIAGKKPGAYSMGDTKN